eukprot:CAMPEP_0181200244 /NCGR_PEP_ID=MMETSP1096-20121128/17651_1 /TAXON_ID=156174 ORGANISM="Chrysochromulina ericina, Strain CCMP281" /NCGR_SAMPLE_ID=MMETSP1096 /ASSEMBLY_ACC=CAM_ASM_000453 /LENGTH=230 /DNA_ID=CAMNT_0023290569 /DNA_START=372 /DNA_END=1062 /DNA_ORIENTATION=+
MRSPRTIRDLPCRPSQVPTLPPLWLQPPPLSAAGREYGRRGGPGSDQPRTPHQMYPHPWVWARAAAGASRGRGPSGRLHRQTDCRDVGRRGDTRVAAAAGDLSPAASEQPALMMPEKHPKAAHIGVARLGAPHLPAVGRREVDEVECAIRVSDVVGGVAGVGMAEIRTAGRYGLADCAQQVQNAFLLGLHEASILPLRQLDERTPGRESISCTCAASPASAARRWKAASI